MGKVDIEESWKSVLSEYFESQRFDELATKIREEYATKSVFPHPTDIFRAFWLTPFESVKVVILGQDPYHGRGQANGLSFSVKQGMQTPPSLKNIYKEITRTNQIIHSGEGDLTEWAKQGVLLLNTVLTVREGEPASHKGLGWEECTDRAIFELSNRRDFLVFMLWGNFARSKTKYIDTSRHLVLESAHPSPLSAHNGFFGNNHFSLCNEYLANHKKETIRW